MVTPGSAKKLGPVSSVDVHGVIFGDSP